MAENFTDQLAEEIRFAAPRFYPQHGTLRNLRIVGHTPKPDHCVYDLIAEFERTSARLAAKIYRQNKSSGAAKLLARNEFQIMEAICRKVGGSRLPGLSRPLADFSHHGAVVTEKPPGLPLQSMIMKAALLPAYSELRHIHKAARASGAWLRAFHEGSGLSAQPLDTGELISEIGDLCTRCRDSGLDDNSIQAIGSGCRNLLDRAPANSPRSAVLNDFTPLNIAIGDDAIGVYDYAATALEGNSLNDVARFLAFVEALEKYPFCQRNLTSSVLDEFCRGYALDAAYDGLVRVLKMKFLLSLFSQGRSVKETAVRKKIMWANVMKRFIQSAVERSMSAA